jgi:hypothetical protein
MNNSKRCHESLLTSQASLYGTLLLFNSEARNPTAEIIMFKKQFEMKKSQFYITIGKK